jgi:hypothetical protein
VVCTIAMDETKRHSKFEVFEPHTIPRPNIYDVISDVQNDVYFTVSTSQFSDGRTLEGSTRKPARSRYIRRRAVARAPRRGTMDRAAFGLARTAPTGLECSIRGRNVSRNGLRQRQSRGLTTPRRTTMGKCGLEASLAIEYFAWIRRPAESRNTCCPSSPNSACLC